MHLLKSDANSRHQNKRHLHPECHLRHLLTIIALKVPKLQTSVQDMYIYLKFFRGLEFFDHGVSTQDSEHDADFIPDLRTDQGASTG